MKTISISIDHENAEDFLECLGLAAAALESIELLNTLEVDHQIQINPANLPEGCAVTIFRNE